MDKILEVKNLAKKYTPVAGVEDVSFVLRSGRILACLGHNGAGKTTTVRAILGLLKMDSGDVTFEGKSYDTDSMGYDRVRQNYGVCMDAPGFYQNMTALKNLELFAELYGLAGKEFLNRAESLLKKLELYEVRNNAVKTYSRGMAQKLALARALMHQPKILFLDEPMSGLDPAARVLIREYLRELAGKEGLAIFLTSHDLSEVEQTADDICILEKGRVILSGGLDELKADFAKEFVYELFFPGAVGVAGAEVAATLGAAKHSASGETLRLELAGEIGLDTASAACAKIGVKLSEFRRQRVSLEKIYFASVNRNENGN